MKFIHRVVTSLKTALLRRDKVAADKVEEGKLTI